MAYDLASRGTGGKDWSCGIGDDDPSPKAAFTSARSELNTMAAGAAVLGLCAVGVFVASSIGGKPSQTVPRTSGPPTMILSPSRTDFYGR